jgi:SAM-dependent methyltransferase
MIKRLGTTSSPFFHQFRFDHATRIIASVAAELDRPVRVLELGCAHGELYRWASYLCQLEYLGIDRNPNFVEKARELYGNRPGFCVRQGLVQEHPGLDFAPDVVLGLEVLEHLPEPDVGPLLARLAALPTARRYVFSVPVEVGPAIAVKNMGSALMGYVRHREYTWKETLWAATYRLDKLPAHGIDHKGFDWRWLRATIRQHFRLLETRCWPHSWIPACIAPNVMFVCEHR